MHKFPCAPQKSRPFTNHDFFHAAFTLIELLVVVAIIAVLAGILMPAYNSAQENGRTTKCVSNLRQIGAAMILFAGDNQGNFPMSGNVIQWSGTDSPPPNGSGQASWMEQLVPYVGSATAAGIKAADPQNLNGKSIFTCPSTSITVPYNAFDKYYSYFNGCYAAYAAGNPKAFAPVKQQLITTPSKQIMSGDNLSASLTQLDADKDDYSYLPLVPPTAAKVNFHHGMINLLYYDGHVAAAAYNNAANGYFNPNTMSTHYSGSAVEDPANTGYHTP